MNISSNLTIDINNLSTYNPGCANEINKIISQCTSFHAKVITQVTQRYYVTATILAALVIIRMWLAYADYGWQKGELYQFIIKRIDLIMVLLAIISIGFLWI